MSDVSKSLEAVHELISLYEAGIAADSLGELLPPELRDVIPERYRAVLTLERLGDAIGKSIASLEDAAERSAAQRRWHLAKVAVLTSGDVAARCAAATNLTDDDFADAAVLARFRDGVERGDTDFVACFTDSLAENLESHRDAVISRLADDAESLTVRGATTELAIVLQAIGAVHVRARRPAGAALLNRLVRVAAVSLVWEPEPAMLCAHSIRDAGTVDLLAQWIKSNDPDVAAFATWVAKKVIADLPPSGRQRLRAALRDFISRVRPATSPRLAPAIERARELIG